MPKKWIFLILLGGTFFLTVPLLPILAFIFGFEGFYGDPEDFPSHRAIAWSSDGQYIAVGGDDGLFVFDKNLNEMAHPISEGVGQVAWEKNNPILLVGTGHIITLPEIQVEEISTFSLHSPAWGSSNGDIAYFNSTIQDNVPDMFIEVAQLDFTQQSPRLVRKTTFQGAVNYQNNTLAWNPHQNLLAAANLNHEIEIWDAATGELRYLFLPPDPPVDFLLTFFLSWNSDGTQLASFSYPNSVYIWDTELGILQDEFSVGSTDKDFISDLDWQPNGMQIATANGHAVKIWDAQTFELLQTLRLPGSVYQLLWSPDGAYIAAIGSKQGRATVWLWDVGKGQLIRETS